MLRRSDFAKALELVETSKKILITSHVRPDGDACGSVKSMMMALESMGKEICPLFLSSVSNWYEFLFEKPVSILGEDVQLEELKQGTNGWAGIDLVVIIDTNSYVQLPVFEQWLRQYKEAGGKVLVLDHHMTSDSLGDIELVNSSAAAAAEVVYDFIAYSGIKITPEMATAMFVSMASDTGWFRFGNKDGRVYRRTAGLIDLGADPARLYQRLYQNFQLPKVKLLARVLEGLELHLDGRVAVKVVRQKDFKETGANRSDTQGIIEEGQKIGSVRAAAMLVEQEDGKFKCSLRSKGEINVRQIAQKYGGGGHDFAAGATFDVPLKDAVDAIIKEMKEQFDQMAAE